MENKIPFRKLTKKNKMRNKCRRYMGFVRRKLINDTDVREGRL